MSKIKFFISRSNFKIKVKNFGTYGKVLSQGIYSTCEIWKPYLIWLEAMAKIKVFLK